MNPDDAHRAATKAHREQFGAAASNIKDLPRTRTRLEQLELVASSRCQGLGGDEPGRGGRPPPAHSPPVPERGPARGGTLADKVAAVHGERHTELSTMRSFFGELRADLEPHLLKEERILVPMIRELEAATAPKVHCGTLAVVLRCRSPWCSETCERRRSAVSTQAGTASCSWQSTRRSRSGSELARSRQRAPDRGPGGW